MEQLSIDLRPRSLSDVYGQAGVLKELTARQAARTWPKAMLFKGPTGTGKTTCAQLVAMAIQCEQPDATGAPCGHCDHCLSIREERWDMGTEILDGGAESGKQDILTLLEGVETTSFYGPNKVFIIEEADQLSKAAMNALLKILEKPQNNVYFILLSMVQGGISTAIQSRCQTFNFKPFTAKELMFALKGVLERIGRWSDPTIPDDFKIKGLGTIALAAQGSLREATQYLEKCLVGSFFTTEDIRNQLGIIDVSSVTQTLQHLLQQDAQFFSDIDGLDLSEFFNISYAAVSDAFVYSVSQYIKNEYFEEQVKSLASHPKLREVVALYDDIYTESRGYIKKAYFVNKVALFMSKKLGVLTEDKARSSKQAELDARARETAASVETTGLGPRTAILTRPVRS